MNMNKKPIAAALLAFALIPLGGWNGDDTTETSEPTEVFPIPPDAAPFGKTFSEWATDWWIWSLETPKSISPIFDGDCNYDQTDEHVFFLAGNTGGTSVRSCTIPADKKIFFPIMNVFSRQLPEAPVTCSYLSTEQQLMDFVTTRYDDGRKVELFAELDGVPIAGPEEHRAHSNIFTWTAPASPSEWIFGNIGPIAAGNACNIPEGARLGASDGFWLMLYSLEPGEHELHFGGKLTYTNGSTFVLDVTYYLTQE